MNVMIIMVMNEGYLKLIDEKYFQLYGFNGWNIKQKLYSCINVKHNVSKFEKLICLYTLLLNKNNSYIYF